MKSLLAITLVFILSLFIVGELKSETIKERIIGTVEEKIQRGEYSGKEVTVEEIMIKGKILSSHLTEFDEDGVRYSEDVFHHVVAYAGTLFHCILVYSTNSPDSLTHFGSCKPFEQLNVWDYD